MFVNVTKCPAKSERKPPVCNFRVSVCFGIIFRIGLGLLLMSLLRLKLGGQFMTFVVRISRQK